MKGIVMQTLWMLLEALATSDSTTTPGDVAKMLGAPVQQVSENNFVAFYETARPIELQGGIAIGQADVRHFKQAGKPPFIVLNRITGTCVSADSIERHLGRLMPPEPPSHPAPNATIDRRAMIKGVAVTFGFKYDRPDCLYSVALHLDEKAR
jgi:hypothetical protein